MPVLAIITLEGNPAHLRAGHDLTLRISAEPAQRPKGFISHTCAFGDNRMVIADVWETEEDLRRYLSLPEFQQAMQEAKMPEPDLRVYETHAHPGTQGAEAPHYGEPSGQEPLYGEGGSDEGSDAGSPAEGEGGSHYGEPSGQEPLYGEGGSEKVGGESSATPEPTRGGYSPGM